MFKHTISELKEAMLCLEAGQVTLKYPFEPHPPDENFRGKLDLDPARCIGCGACANACPAHLIRLTDAGEMRTLFFELGRCTFCAACRDVCPEKAVTLTQQFELSTTSTADLDIRLELHLVLCRECGAVVNTRRAIELVWIKLAPMLGAQPWLDLCPDCRRQFALQTPDLAIELEVAP